MYHPIMYPCVSIDEYHTLELTLIHQNLNVLRSQMHLFSWWTVILPVMFTLDSYTITTKPSPIMEMPIRKCVSLHSIEVEACGVLSSVKKGMYTHDIDTFIGM